MPEPITMTIAGVKIASIALVKVKALLIIAKVKAYLTAQGICIHCVSVSAISAMIVATFKGKSASLIIAAGVGAGLTHTAANAIYYKFLA